MRRILPALLVLFASTAATCLIAELAVRWLRPGLAAGRELTGNPFWRYDADLGWSQRQGERGVFSRAEFSHQVSINSMGFRDRERSPVPASEAAGGRRPFRIAVYGDSFTWGHGVEDAEIFTRRLEATLETCEVWNLAVSGYSTDQELLLFRKTASLVRPDLVLVMISRNDFTGNLEAIDLGYPKPRFAIEQEKLVLEGVPVPRAPAWGKPLRWLRIRSAMINGLSALLEDRIESGGRAGDEVKAIRRGAEDEQRAMFALLDAFVLESTSSGARFAAALVPSTAHVYSGEIPAVEAERFEAVRSWGRERGVAVLDLVPAFRKSSAESGIWFHYRKDRHWNAAGHRLAADTLKPLLEEFLPRCD